jgi:hypothetical protein
MRMATKSKSDKTPKAEDDAVPVDAAQSEVPAPEPGDEQSARLPLFYKNPTPLSSERHAKKSISRTPDYSFAVDTNSVPVTAMECSRAMQNYPIVFTTGDPVVPVAVLGLRGAKNQFVEPDGAWRAGAYIPAYIRRYPFILMESPDKLQFTLCIDEDSNLLVDGDGQPLFEGDTATEAANKALEFCSAYQGQHSFTLEFTAALEKYGLLVENRASVALKSGEQLSLSGFRMVDEAQLAALPDDVFLDWRQRGWVPLIYCHLLSMGNWQALVEGQDESE